MLEEAGLSLAGPHVRVSCHLGFPIALLPHLGIPPLEVLLFVVEERNRVMLLPK